jgi:quercetin dioxygenase-like cupin family protein
MWTRFGFYEAFKVGFKNIASFRTRIYLYFFMCLSSLDGCDMGLFDDMHPPIANRDALVDGTPGVDIYPELAPEPGEQVKVQGTFPWHYHDGVEEMFLVWRGRLRVEFRDRIVELGPGELVLVPRGVEHRTAADEEAEVILFEPSGS